jgi:cell division protein ZapB
LRREAVRDAGRRLGRINFHSIIVPPLTHLESGFYIHAMPREDLLGASDLDLRSLEARVNELIRTCQTLKSENSSLRSRQDQLVAERAALIEKTELARNRVEAMIQRLKSLETGA